MKIRVLGGGWYGCHIASSLLLEGHEVELHEVRNELFGGASGNNPARLHDGFHYPRSYTTRLACRQHRQRFMQQYGHLTRQVPINVYAVARDDSLVDYANFCQSLATEVEYITIDRPEEFGLSNVEGAVLTGERHIVINKARQHFIQALGSHVVFNQQPGAFDDSQWDLTIDCTFCANDQERIDRFEPCLMALVEGPANIAVTVMDGPFGSLYPWEEERNLCSLTSASLTPLSKECRTYAEAQAVMGAWPAEDLMDRAKAMMAQMAHYWPAIMLYKVANLRLSIRAMPKSGADARLVDLARIGQRTLRLRPGKIDAIFEAESLVRQAIHSTRSLVGGSIAECVVPLEFPQGLFPVNGGRGHLRVVPS